ncbi:hypothetical protein KZO85_05085 [Chromohalobacter canadensis]|uniref:Uncharacterized protein n=1 Tax=Chromohalobacter moromii TaxID=2860329 RepID=A0A9X2WZJ1_9GAMM|nr:MULTISPECIES: hypothetical protein [Chromohalobacter]MCT8467938.1 hypothetical protein [Chromohalobacter canadensis]MCT8470313.1 hypothetical protein [Chromohalobacter canadensis]MCT8498435.1 hypothetical protein [Chromohalobacter canadensis]MCT8503900.1 hypothetical protein [Chromohalobacter moromii]
MQSKYKTPLTGLFLMGAGLMTITAWQEDDPITQGLLIAAIIVLTTLAWRHLSRRAWALAIPLCALLLLALLWHSPMTYAVSVWLWPIMLLAPQPRPMRYALLVAAALGWWHMQAPLGMPQATLSGALLAALMTLGFAKAIEHSRLRQELERRYRLTPEDSLWSLNRLREDLSVEWSRRQRENVYAELLVIRPYQRGHTVRWRLRERLAALIHAFEGCYRVDAQTFAVLLISRDEQHAALRRDAISTELQEHCRIRIAPVAPDLDPITLGHELSVQKSGLHCQQETTDHA